MQHISTCILKFVFVSVFKLHNTLPAHSLWTHFLATSREFLQIRPQFCFFCNVSVLVSCWSHLVQGNCQIDLKLMCAFAD